MTTRKLLISELEDKNRCPHCDKLGLSDNRNEEGDLNCGCGERVYKTLPLPLVSRYTGYRSRLI